MNVFGCEKECRLKIYKLLTKCIRDSKSIDSIEWQSTSFIFHTLNVCHSRQTCWCLMFHWMACTRADLCIFVWSIACSLSSALSKNSQQTAITSYNTGNNGWYAHFYTLSCIYCDSQNVEDNDGFGMTLFLWWHTPNTNISR